MIFTEPYTTCTYILRILLLLRRTTCVGGTLENVWGGGGETDRGWGKNEKGYPCRHGRLHVVAIATKRGTGRRRVACFTANSPVTNYPPHVRSARVMFGPKIKTAHLPRRRPTCTVPAALKLRARNLVYGPGRLRLYPFHLTCPPRSADAHTYAHALYYIRASAGSSSSLSSSCPPHPAHRAEAPEQRADSTACARVPSMIR